MIYFCCDQRRRNDLAGSAFNGIDYLEVLDHEIEQSDPANRQKKLVVHFINDLAAGALDKPNILIEGGERTPGIFATNVAVDVQDAKLLDIDLNQYGDFSIYTFRLVQNPQNLAPPAIIDPLFAAVDFSFKVDCPSDFDCQPRCDCPAAPPEEPEINYLAKDYASFRRLMLDRMAALMPQWRERNPADLGVALVEMLAYVGDHLSYQQDAVATEAYLGTARRRVSVRRHAKLVDYHMHDGCNARAWVQVRLKEGAAAVTIAPGDTQFFTRIPGQLTVLPDDPQLRAQAQAIFEPMETVSLFADHNDFKLYTWSDQRCCLPKGATHATLKDFHPDLKPGHVVIFEEVLNPHTGGSEDADPKHRCAVRLVDVQARDENNQPLRDGLTNQQITQISWDDADALAYPFCVSAQTDKSHGAKFIDNVTVVRGNIVLADHGATIGGEELGSVGPALPVVPSSTGCERCAPPDLEPMAPRFRPIIANRPLTFAALHDPSGPARAAMVWSERAAEAQIKLAGIYKSDPTPWQPRADLLQSRGADNHFVVEIESDGQAQLRFGDDTLGRRPKSETKFTADYRVGNGAAGNIGAEALAHVHTGDALLAAATREIRNPLAAQGGMEPETMEQARAYAPAAYRTQKRAVTEADYAAVAGRHPGVQRAIATFRWTGSWHTVFITVDRQDGQPVDGAFEASVRRFVEPFRMAGHDIEVEGPLPVSLEIDMHVCADPAYFRADVKRELLELFSTREFADGRLGLFHPDNFTFGQTVYLSPLIAAAQAVPGVTSVQIGKFQRQGQPDNKPLAAGKLELGRLEIARCDNDRNFPEHGVFDLSVGGGK